jgi:hypothetical protein
VASTGTARDTARLPATAGFSVGATGEAADSARLTAAAITGAKSWRVDSAVASLHAGTTLYARSAASSQNIYEAWVEGRVTSHRVAGLIADYEIDALVRDHALAGRIRDHALGGEVHDYDL